MKNGRTRGSNAPDAQRADQVVAAARKSQTQRESTYREQALKIYPWVCGRCAREFTAATVRMLTVHHRDHNHDNNPPDGSNWELLCHYCHDNEHAKLLEHAASGGATASGQTGAPAGYKAFAGLGSLLKGRK